MKFLESHLIVSNTPTNTSYTPMKRIAQPNLKLVANYVNQLKLVGESSTYVNINNFTNILFQVPSLYFSYFSSSVSNVAPIQPMFKKEDDDSTFCHPKKSAFHPKIKHVTDLKDQVRDHTLNSKLTSGIAKVYLSYCNRISSDIHTSITVIYILSCINF